MLAKECKVLERLDFADTNVTIISLFSILSKSSALISLDLSECREGKLADLQGILIFHSSLALDFSRININQALKFVNLSSTPVTDPLISYLSECAPNLGTLILDSCSRVTDESIIKIIENCPLLERLDCSFIDGLTDESILALIRVTKSREASSLETLCLSACDSISPGPIIQLAQICLDTLSLLVLDGCIQIQSTIIQSNATYRDDLECTFEGSVDIRAFVAKIEDDLPPESPKFSSLTRKLSLISPLNFGRRNSSNKRSSRLLRSQTSSVNTITGEDDRMERQEKIREKRRSVMYSSYTSDSPSNSPSPVEPIGNASNLHDFHRGLMMNKKVEEPVTDVVKHESPKEESEWVGSWNRDEKVELVESPVSPTKMAPIVLASGRAAKKALEATLVATASVVDPVVNPVSSPTIKPVVSNESIDGKTKVLSESSHSSASSVGTAEKRTADLARPAGSSVLIASGRRPRPRPANSKPSPSPPPLVTQVAPLNPLRHASPPVITNTQSRQHTAVPQWPAPPTSQPLPVEEIKNGWGDTPQPWANPSQMLSSSSTLSSPHHLPSPQIVHQPFHDPWASSWNSNHNQYDPNSPPIQHQQLPQHHRPQHSPPPGSYNQHYDNSRQHFNSSPHYPPPPLRYDSSPSPPLPRILHKGQYEHKPYDLAPARMTSASQQMQFDSSPSPAWGSSGVEAGWANTPPDTPNRHSPEVFTHRPSVPIVMTRPADKSVTIEGSLSPSPLNESFPPLDLVKEDILSPLAKEFVPSREVTPPVEKEVVNERATMRVQSVEQEAFIYSRADRGKMLLKLKIETKAGGHQTLAVHEVCFPSL